MKSSRSHLLVALGAATLNLILCCRSVAAQELRVYRLDGTLQCGMGHERTLEEDRATLEKLGAKILSAEKRVIPARVSQICGAPTGHANTYVISSDDWAKIKKGFVGPAGFAIWIYDTKTVWVYKYDGSLLCELGTAVDLKTMEEQLTQAGIAVVSEKKASDGLMHVQMCGASTGRVNAYEINTSDLDKAMSLGFAYLVTSDTSKTMLSEPSPAPAASRMNADGLPLPWPFPW